MACERVTALKLSIDEKQSIVLMFVQEMKIGNIERSMHMLHAIIIEEKDTSYYYSFKKIVSSTMERIWIPKDSHVLTNHQRPIKVWQPKSST